MSAVSQTIRADLIQKLKDPFNNSYSKGEFLPSVRALSETYQVAPLTINRLLKSMEKDGFLSAYPRQGYKIIVEPKELNQSGVVIYLSSKRLKENDWDISQNYRQHELQMASAVKNWPLVSLDVTEMTVEDVFKKLAEFKIVGVILDRVYLDIVKKLRELSIPLICLDVWFEYFDIDEISRDEFQGARIASDFALKNDFKSFAWVGPIQGNANGQIRYSAVKTALIAAGEDFEENWVVDANINSDESFLKALLVQDNRPKLFFIFWKNLALKFARVAESMGLKLGEDIYIIGWCTREQFEHEYKPVCPNLANNCVTVVWSINEIASACMQRIQDKITEPNRPSQRILVKMYLHKTSLEEKK